MYRWVRRHYQFQLRGRRFLEAPWSGGLVLLISVAVAMLLANRPPSAEDWPMGLVLRIPFKRKFPLILHSMVRPSSVFDNIPAACVFYY